MTDPTTFGVVVVVVALLVFGAYHVGLSRGLARGFNQGFKCADKFRHLKRSEAIQRKTHLHL
jgi:hypothetical protein